MRRALVLVGLTSCVAALGCGPLVTLDSFDDDGGSGSDVGTEPGPGVDVDDGRDEPPGGIDGGSPGGDGEPPGDGDGDATGDPGECWIVQDLFKAPDDVAVYTVDQDGDGAQEIWVAPIDDFGPGPGSTSLVRIDETGTPGPELQLDGFLLGLPDIDGDGVLDLLVLRFAGQPTFDWARGHADGTFDLPGTSTDLPLGGGVNGFFDANGDGPADAFAFSPDGTLRFLRGDGLGGFVIASELALGVDGFGFVTQVEHGAGLGLLQIQDAFGGPGGGDGGCIPREYGVVRTTTGELEMLATSYASVGLGPAVRSFAYNDGLVTAFVHMCGERGEFLHEVRQIVAFPGNALILEGASVEDVAWAAPADFDGDGVLDVAFARSGADTIAWIRGHDPITYGAIESLPIASPEVRGNAVRAVDLDGDGREELLRGWVLDDGEPASLSYDHIRLGPCE